MEALSGGKPGLLGKRDSSASDERTPLNEQAPVSCLPRSLPCSCVYVASWAFLKKVSLGFPQNPAAEDVLQKRAQEADEDREKAESKLMRRLDHRRRLLDVLKASHVGIAPMDTIAMFP